MSEDDRSEKLERNCKLLTAQRRGHKTYATKIMNEAEALLINHSNEDKLQLITFMQVLSDRCSIIEALDNRILENLVEENAIEDEVMSSSD